MDQSRSLCKGLPGDDPPITKLFSSPWVRCVQTLEPLADSLGLPIIDTENLGEVVTLPVHDGGDAWVTSAWLGGRAVSFLDQAVREYQGSRIVACSHGDVIPAVIALIVGRDGLSNTDVRCRKGGRFTLVYTDAACTELTYHEPPQ